LDYRIVVAANDTDISRKAIDYALQLYQRLSGNNNSLEIVYAIGLNPTAESDTFFGGLDRVNNLDIVKSAHEEYARLEHLLSDVKELVVTPYLSRQS
ncbi:hypothetical protein BDF14DRAFT_1716788, partial [Spinellus fusiger]